MASINFTAVISGTVDHEVDLEDVVSEYLSDYLGSDVQVEEINDLNLES